MLSTPVGFVALIYVSNHIANCRVTGSAIDAPLTKDESKPLTTDDINGISRARLRRTRPAVQAMSLRH